MKPSFEHQLQISDMSCASCVHVIERALQQVPGVLEVNVNFAAQNASVYGDVPIEVLLKAVNNAGYTAKSVNESDSHVQQQSVYYQLLCKACAAALVGVPLLLLGHFDLLPSYTDFSDKLVWVGIGLLTLLTIIYSGGHIYKSAWKSFLSGTATMDSLVTLGTATAWWFSMLVVLFPSQIPSLAQYVYFEAATVILAFINLGAAIEMRIRTKTASAIGQLLSLQPKTASVIRDAEECSVAVTAISVGEIVRVRPGEIIPLDGVVIEGQSTIDEAILTGESMPISKKVGDKIAAGTMNKAGSVLFRVTQVGEDTKLAQVVSLVRRAQNTKPQIAKVVDMIAAYFVPSVVVVAALTAIIWFLVGPEPKMAYMLVTSMTVLVIACPCALGLAVPISVMIGASKAAESGILIRSGEALQQSGRLTTIIFDKTGTLTKGLPSVVGVYPANSWQLSAVLQWAASVEQASEHPIAKAIVAAANEQQLARLTLDNFLAIVGLGVQSNIQGKFVLLGNQALMEQHHINLHPLASHAKQVAANAQTPVYVAVEGQLVGLLAIADPLKVDAQEAMASLQKLGIKLRMITGDNQVVAQAIATQVGINDFIAGALPQDKLAYIEKLQAQGEIVGMVGDGVNDAPALAKADVGFAIATGSDIAVESADVTLMRDSLSTITETILISRATLKNIKQNLFGAFLYNNLGIPIAAGILYPVFGVLLNPMIAGAAMALSSLTVVANANRLRWTKVKK